jgi:hypothetical protein
LLVTANVVPSSPILVTLMMVALSFSKTLVLTRATWPNIPEDAILHENKFFSQGKTWLIGTPVKLQEACKLEIYFFPRVSDKYDH